MQLDVVLARLENMLLLARYAHGYLVVILFLRGNHLEDSFALM